MKASEINKMSIAERLRTMEEIWDSLVHEDAKIESPDWHNKVLNDRRTAIENGSANLISITDLKASLKVGN